MTALTVIALLTFPVWPGAVVLIFRLPVLRKLFDRPLGEKVAIESFHDGPYR